MRLKIVRTIILLVCQLYACMCFVLIVFVMSFYRILDLYSDLPMCSTQKQVLKVYKYITKQKNKSPALSRNAVGTLLSFYRNKTAIKNQRKPRKETSPAHFKRQCDFGVGLKAYNQSCRCWRDCSLFQFALIFSLTMSRRFSTWPTAFLHLVNPPVD